MSIDLVVGSSISESTQSIQDQNGKTAALQISTVSTNIPTGTKLVFGVGSTGVGEWLQNTHSSTSDNFGIDFYGNSQLRMRMTNGGLFGVGTTAPGATLHVHGSVRFDNIAALAGTDLVIDGSGNVGKQSSSARFKENICELKADFQRLFRLQPVAFNYKGNGTKTLGYLAEDVASQGLDELVTYDGQGRPESVQYKLIPVYLLELLKEQHRLIRGLQDELQALKTGLSTQGPSARPA